MHGNNNKDIFMWLASSIFIVLLTSCQHSPVERNTEAEEAARSVTNKLLQRFASMEEFEAYRERVRSLGEKNQVWWSRIDMLPSEQNVMLAQNTTPCNPALEDCPGATALEETVVTAQKVSKSKTSITNNQDAEVDEGDIIKLSGRFLVILQDGRLFSVDTSGRLKVMDRIDLYEHKDDGVWYDELLVYGNRLVVTAYSFEDSASRIIVVSIDDVGVFKIEARYERESDDYFSGNNYASRLVGGELLIYTPVNMSDFRDGGPLKIPRIRKSTSAGGVTEWKPLFHITDVYKPIQATLTPQLHVISICPISSEAAFECRSRGVVAPPGHELYVSGRNAYLWVVSDIGEWGAHKDYWRDCSQLGSLPSPEPLSSAAYRFPIKRDGIEAVHTQGVPYDQFAFEERDGRLLALLVRAPRGCYLHQNMPMQFAAISLNRFSTTPGSIASFEYVRLPNVPRVNLQNRYTDTHVVYGSPEGAWQAYWHGTEPYVSASLVAVPLQDPSHPTVLQLPHSAERVESFGNNVVVFGYFPDFKMGVSSVLLQSRPRVADTKQLGDLVESEGRSHAFNYISEENGSGTFGLPTIVSRRGQRWSYSAEEESSDVQFFSADKSLRITPVGFLGGPTGLSENYECEVSCIAWYGNARPIFLDGRIFALTGPELVEGTIVGKSIAETGRVKITSQPSHTR